MAEAEMMFLLPVGGVVDYRFGILTTPGHKATPTGIKSGMVWAADNQAYTQAFDADKYFTWLSGMEAYQSTCLFCAVPDAVGDAVKTLRLYDQWRANYSGWPVAFVAQDGQEDLPIPDDCDTVFIGGTTGWKLSSEAESVIYRALDAGKKIHIGRVNYKRRYDHFSAIHGSSDWTCDGTRMRYDGTKKTVIAWAEYMVAPRQLRFSIFDSSSLG